MRRFLVILLVATAALRADVIHLKGGGTLEGKVIEENEREVRIRTGAAEMTVTRAQIVRIERGESPVESYQRQAAALKDDDAEGHYKLALYCLKHKLTAQAFAELRRVLELKKDHAEALARLRPLVEKRSAPLLARARKLQEEGDYGQAEKLLISILEQYYDGPHVAAAHHHLALGFAARGQYALALTRWRRALAVDPQFLDACQGAAAAAIEMGKWPDALEFTERAAAIAGQSPAGAVLKKRAADLRTLADLQKQAAAAKPDAKRLAAISRVLLDLGLREHALLRLQEAYDAGARDPRLIKTLAEHHEQAGRVRLALELTKQLLTANPRDDALLRRRAVLERLLLVGKAFATRDRQARERLILDIARSGASFATIEAALRECTEREPQKTGLGQGSFLVDEILTEATCAVYVPKGYDPRRPWPLILAFHRKGESGKEHFYNWETVADSQRYIVLCPDSPRRKGDWRFGHIKHALSALRHATKTYNIDTNHVYLAGTGSGGLLAWSVAVRHPDLFAALVIRNAPLDEVSRLYLRATTYLPTYLAASEQNSPAILAPMRDAFKALESWGGNVRTEEAGGSARNPALPELNAKIAAWLKDQRRNPYASRARLVSFEFSNATAFWLRVDRFAKTVFDPDRKLDIKAPFGQEYDPEQLRFIYLEEMNKTLGRLAGVVHPGNRINIAARHIEKITVFLDDRMVDLEKPVRIFINGELAFRGKVERSLETLFESARYHRDPRMCYAASVSLTVR